MYKLLGLVAVLASLCFGDVIHQTTKWQSLGRETIADAGSSNNGVFYLDGSNWVMLTDATEFTVGQSVEFKVEVWKEFQGTHISDVAKVWMNETELAAEEWLLADNGNKKWGYYSYYDGNVTNGSQSTGSPELLGAMNFTYTFSEAKEYELVARTMCSDDLARLDGNYGPYQTVQYIDQYNNWHQKGAKLPTQADWDLFTATSPGTTYQGEIEKYTFNVSNVPEPATLSLLGFGLLGMFFIRRKK